MRRLRRAFLFWGGSFQELYYFTAKYLRFMALSLLPFPRYARLPFGQLVEELPVTRYGIRNLPAGTFTETEGPGYAELTIRRNKAGTVCRGICGLLPWQAFQEGTVHPHENTLVSRLERQESLVLPDLGALGKPILLTVASLKEWWAAADQNHVSSKMHLQLQGDDNRYTLRDYTPRDGAGAKSLALALNRLGPLVIADGHHRAETHARLGENGAPGFSYVPVCLIGADELHIGVFARIITAPDTDAMFERLRTHFSVEELSQPIAPQSVGEWLLAYRSRYFRLHRTVPQGDATDVDWLDSVVLTDACGITDVRTDGRIAFEPVTGPENGLIPDEFPPESLCLVGFPLPKERFFAEVAAGRVLPPKSTRFEPRVPSGLVVWGGSGI